MFVLVTRSKSRKYILTLNIFYLYTIYLDDIICIMNSKEIAQFKRGKEVLNNKKYLTVSTLHDIINTNQMNLQNILSIKL